MDAMVPPAALVPTRATLSQWPVLNAHRVYVTPEMAADWLATANTDNRHIRKSVVRKYAAMMTAGEWKPTHQGVAFSSRRLIDGQHRLAAVVASGKPQWMVVFVEQDDEIFGVLDRGEKRTLGDELRADRRISEAVSFIARLTNDDYVTSYSLNHARNVADVFSEHIQSVLTACGTMVRARSAGSVRAAVTIRLACAAGDDRQYILDQWRAWCLLDVADMSRSIQSGVKRMDGVGHAAGGSSGNERAAIAWICFNPAERGLMKIQVKKVVTEMAEMADAARSVLEPAQ
jgi:hypothetical protein